MVGFIFILSCFKGSTDNTYHWVAHAFVRSYLDIYSWPRYPDLWIFWCPYHGQPMGIAACNRRKEYGYQHVLALLLCGIQYNRNLVRLFPLRMGLVHFCLLLNGPGRTNTCYHLIR